MAIPARRPYQVGDLADCTLPLDTRVVEDLTAETRAQIGQIVVWKGEVILGQEQLYACEGAGLDPVFTSLPDDKDPVEFLLKQAGLGECWDETERTLRAYQIWDFLERARKGELPEIYADFAKKWTQKQIAAAHKVSVRMISHANHVFGEYSTVADEVRGAVKERLIRMSDASSVSGKPEGLQRQAVAMVRKGEAKTVSKAARQIIEDQAQADAASERDVNEEAADKAGVMLRAMGLSELLQETRAGSVDLILTYPPMDGRSQEELRNLLEFADQALAVHGAMVVMVDGRDILKVAGLLAEGNARTKFITELDYRDDEPQPGLGPGNARKVRRRSLLLFGSPAFRLSDAEEVIRLPPRDSDPRPGTDPRLDTGAQVIIERFAGPGTVVCDPIAGGRIDFAAGAVAAGSNFTGSFHDRSCVDRALAKLAKTALWQKEEMSSTADIPGGSPLPDCEGPGYGGLSPSYVEKAFAPQSAAGDDYPLSPSNPDANRDGDDPILGEETDKAGQMPRDPGPGNGDERDSQDDGMGPALSAPATGQIVVEDSSAHEAGPRSPPQGEQGSLLL